MQASEEFARIQQALEAADTSLTEALDARAKAVQQLAQLRARHPDSFYRLPRDEFVIGRAREQTKVFPEASVEPVFRELLSACERMIAPRTVSYVGAPGSFAHLAARRHFGSASTLQSAESVEQTLDEVARGRACYGVVPLETTTDGAITETLHQLVRADPKICAEISVNNNYHLISSTGNATDVEKIYGTPAAIAACEQFLRSRFPKATVLDVPNDDVAAEFARGDHGAAAVGTDLLKHDRELRVVKERIEDVVDVETRFAIVGNELPSRTGQDRTVLAVAVHDKPGALYDALQPLAKRDVNLTRLESRPAHGAAWRYLFFMEMEGHMTDRPLLTALEELRALSRYVKVLGSYPRPATP